MNDEMVEDFVDEPNVPNNAIGGCGCFSVLVILTLLGWNIRSCDSPSTVLEQQHANQSNVQTEIYAKEQERRKQVQEELSQRVAKETLEQNKVREEQRRVFEATKKEMDEKKAIETQFLRSKYDSLNEFKDSEQFAGWGFADIGPFGPWLKDVEARISGKFESPEITFAVAHLLKLGREYEESNGKETDYSRFANDCIKGILDGQTKDQFERQATVKLSSLDARRKRLNAILNSPPEKTMVQCWYYLDDYEPELSRQATDSRNAWQEAAFDGDLAAMRKHHSDLVAILGRDFLGFYWDVDDIMRDERKIKKILRESDEYRRRQKDLRESDG